MSRSCALLILCLIGTSAIAQPDAKPATIKSLTGLEGIGSSLHLYDEYVESGNKLGLFGDFSLNSSALTNSFYAPFLKGGTITEELKGDVQNRMGGFNTFGLDLDYGLKYSHRIDSLFGKPIGLIIFASVADRQHADASFSTNLFNGIFSGNKQFEGDTVKLAGASVNWLTYQQAKIGAAYEDGRTTIGASASFIMGEQLFRAELNRADLYTAEFGTELSLDLNMSILRSDTASSEIGAGNGYGWSTDLFFEYGDRVWGNFLFEIRDLGQITWNEESLEFNTDTSYHFEGFYVPSLLDLQDSVQWAGQSDSLSDAVTPSFTKGSRSTALPAWLTLTYAKVLKNPNYTIYTGVRHRVNANYNPYFFIRCSRLLGSFIAEATFGYGGYGGVNFGLRASANFRNKVRFFVSGQYIEGIVAPKLTGSKGLSAGLTFFF
jgi:hypothetical protein